MRIKLLLLFLYLFSFIATLTSQSQSSVYINIRDTSELKTTINLTLSDIKETKKLNQEMVYSLLKNSLILKDTSSFFNLCKETDKNYFRKNSLDQEAILFLKESQRIIGIEDTRYGNLNNSIGNYYRRLNYYLEAQDYYFKSVVWYKKHETHNTTIPLGNIAQIYVQNGNFEKSLEYNELALSYSLKLEDRDSRLYNIIYDYARLGAIYNKLQKNRKAEEFFNKSLSSARQYKDENVMLFAIVAAIKFYSKTKNKEEFENLLNEGNALLIKDGENLSLNDVEMFLLAKNQHYLTNDINIALDPNQLEIKSPSQKKEFLQYSIDYYRLKEDVGNLTKSYENLLEENRKVERESKKNLISNIEDKYLNRELEQKNKELTNTLRVRKTITITILAILGVILSFLVLQLYNNRRYKKLNKLLKANTKAQLSLNNKLKKSNQELERFVYIASHDLKTPLVNILNFTGLLEKQLETNKDEKTHKYLSFIKEGGTRLNSLIKNTLEYSKVSELNQTDTIDLNLLVDNIGDSKDIKKRNALIFKSGKLPTVQANKESIFLLFKNLIENGIIYNKSETPKINIYTSEGPKFVSIFLKDNGIGIPKDYQEKIFTMYFRLHNHKEYPGSGLGLSVCRKIIDELKGEIHIQSTKDVGSTFEIKLPYSLIV